MLLYDHSPTFLGEVRVPDIGAVVVADEWSLVPTVVVVRGSLPEVETDATSCWIHYCWAGVKIGALLEEDDGTSEDEEEFLGVDI